MKEYQFPWYIKILCFVDNYFKCSWAGLCSLIDKLEAYYCNKYNLTHTWAGQLVSKNDYHI